MTQDPAPPSPSSQGGQSLSNVLAQVFDAPSNDAFAERFVGLVAALLNTKPVFLFALDADNKPTLLAATTRRAAPDKILAIVAHGTTHQTNDPVRDGSHLTAPLTLPSGDVGIMVLELAQGSNIATALAHERVVALQALASARFQNPEIKQLRTTMSAAVALSGPSAETMQSFADQVSILTDADSVAVGQFDGSKIGLLAVSGQGDGAKRAILPDRLRREMSNTGSQKISSPQKKFMGAPGQDHGLVLELDKPRRNTDLMVLVAAAVSAAVPVTPQRVPLWRRARRWALIVAVLTGIAMIPLPDQVSLNSTVTASSLRIITAPYSAAVVEINVADNGIVTANETTVARMDTTEIVNDLIATQADYASALLQRETVRASRDAARLRSSELEVERISARIAVLESRRDSAVLIAPISGLVIGPNLQERRGAVVRQGDQLMQIADPSRLHLDVDILQSDLARVQEGMVGRFRPDFDPSLVFDMDVTAISPAALDTDRAPVFSGRAAFDQDTAQLRHGMTGVMSLDRSWRPAGLILWDGLRNWVLLRLWL